MGKPELSAKNLDIIPSKWHELYYVGWTDSTKNLGNEDYGDPIMAKCNKIAKSFPHFTKKGPLGGRKGEFVFTKYDAHRVHSKVTAFLNRKTGNLKVRKLSKFLTS